MMDLETMSKTKEMREFIEHFNTLVKVESFLTKHLEFGVKRKYIKVFLVDKTKRRFAWCFIDTSGDIRRPEGFHRAAPYVMGNIFRPKTYESWDWTGPPPMRDTRPDKRHEFTYNKYERMRPTRKGVDCV